MRNILKRCLVAVFSMVYILGAVAVSASPIATSPIEYIQPDGAKVNYYVYGDENYSFMGDDERFLLEKNSEGALVYVTNDGSAPVVYMDNGTRPENAVTGFDARPAQAAAEEIMDAPLAAISSAEPNTTAPVLENRKLLVVGVEYNDCTFDSRYFPDSLLYDKHFSYTSSFGSVADYYTKVSDGLFTFVPAFKTTDSNVSDTDGDDGYGILNDGTLKIKLNKNHPNPESSSATQSAQQMAMDVFTAIDPYIDFSVYDVDGTGMIERDEVVFMFVIAGYEYSLYSSSTTKSLHAHRSYVANKTKMCDGVNVGTGGYTMTGAMQAAGVPLGIGTSCHELGHNLGLPDFYNTAGANVEYTEMNYTSLMSSGGHGRNAAGLKDYSPCHIDAWSRYYLGWYKPEDFLEVDEKYVGEVKIEPITSNLPDAYKLVKIRVSTDPSEYYLLEYRVPEGYDYGLKTYGDDFKAGIAMYHVDDTRLGQYNQLDCGVKNLFSGRYVKGINSKGNASYAFLDYNSFLNNAQPFWSCDNNKFPMFSNLSYPNDDLTTANGDVTKSGVKIEFLTSPDAPVAKVKLGELTTNYGIGIRSSVENIFMFNHTDSAKNFNVYAAEFDGDKLVNVFKLNKTTSVGANTYARDLKDTAGTKIDELLVKGKTYKLFDIDFSTLKPGSISKTFIGLGTN